MYSKTSPRGSQHHPPQPLVPGSVANRYDIPRSVVVGGNTAAAATQSARTVPPPQQHRTSPRMPIPPIGRTQQQHQQNNFFVANDGDLIPWQRIHHGNIPPWEQERLLREVLTAMLLTDMQSQQQQKQQQQQADGPSLHTRATNAVNEVISGFVRSAIVGAQQQQQQTGSSNSNNGQAATAVSLGALRLPSGTEQGQNDLLNGGGGSGGSEQQWVGSVRDRRQMQLERLLSDAQNEAVVLKQQLEDITRAHDDTQRALNQSYHEYDSLQRHILEIQKQQQLQQQQQKEKSTTQQVLGSRRSPPAQPPQLQQQVQANHDDAQDP